MRQDRRGLSIDRDLDCSSTHPTMRRHNDNDNRAGVSVGRACEQLIWSFAVSQAHTEEARGATTSKSSYETSASQLDTQGRSFSLNQKWWRGWHRVHTHIHTEVLRHLLRRRLVACADWHEHSTDVKEGEDLADDLISDLLFRTPPRPNGNQKNGCSVFHVQFTVKSE
jgi:hypothetical protein